MHLLILFIIILIPFAGVSQDNWITFSDFEGKVKFDFMKKPEKSFDTLSIGKELVYVTNWKLEVDDREHMNSYYKVSISKYPHNYIHSDSSYSLIEGFLNSTVNSLIENNTFEHLSSKVDLKNGYPGKAYKFKNVESNVLFKIHSYLIQNLLIEMIVISKPDEWFSKSTNRFLSSLDLSNLKENKIEYGFTFIDVLTYEINFPEIPEEKSMLIDSEYGKLNLKLKVMERKLQEGNLVFLSGETKYPDSFVLEEENKDEFFAKSIQGSLNSTNAELIESKEIKNKNYEGVEFSSSLFDGVMIGHYKLILKNNRLYMLGVLTSNQNLDQEAEAYFNSFKIK